MNTIHDIQKLILQNGHLSYGESMTVLSHSIQSGLIAKQKNLEDHLVIAAFLHDVGHMLPMSDATEQDMDGYGSIDHEDSGADYLKEMGFGEEVTMPIRNHVLSKRYLCTVNENYYDTLSDASKKTMEFQGGKLDTGAVREFENQPFFKSSIELRYIDDEAKEENFLVTEDHLDYFLKLTEQILAQRY